MLTGGFTPMKPIFPPRPKGKVPSSELPHLEKAGKWLVQRKFNGDRSVIFRAADGTLSIFGRYGKPYERYKMSGELRRELSALKFEDGKSYWLDCELIHEHFPHTVVLFDILQAGRYLFGAKQETRLQLLSDICNNPKKNPSDPAIALSVSPHVWMAETWDADFLARFQDHIHLDVIEGLMLRRKDSVLDNYGSSEYEVAWQVRCRKPGPTYAL
jgi:ATP-dependent DNA ligase